MSGDDRSPESRPFEVLARLARLATEDLELGPMLQRVTDALCEEFDWEFVALIRVDRAARRFVCEALTSRVPTEVHPGYSRPFGSGVVGHVAETGKPVVLDDAASFPGFIETMERTRSELCVPIRHRGEVIGLLNLESPRPAVFGDSLSRAEAIAGQIAGAIASARHLDEVRARATTLSVLSNVSRAALEARDLDDVLQRIVTFLRDHFDFHLVAIVVADPRDQAWSHRAFAFREPTSMIEPETWPIDRGVVGRAIRAGEPQLVDDVNSDADYFPVDDRVVSEFVAPIRFQGEVLGAINIESDRPGVFGDDVRKLVALAADQVAGAVRLALVNRRLSEISHQLAAANQELERLSFIDPLTGIANRRRFDSAFEIEWRRHARAKRSLALILLDVDSFKAFNDACGHPAGDDCLRRIAGVLTSTIRRAGDLAARFGGEEFAVLLHEADAQAALSVAEQLRTGILDLGVEHPDSRIAEVVSASFGVAAVVPVADGDPGELVQRADAALYEAKRGGRNRVVAANHEPA
jgi:diguanylate cyclase (GGDEF)-like protein